MHDLFSEDIDRDDTLPRFKRIDDENRLPKQLLRGEPAQPKSQAPVTEEFTASAREAAVASMQEYYTLKQALYLSTLAITAVGSIVALFAYSSDTALSYLIGSLCGLLYLRMLAKGVERLGLGAASTGGSARIAIFVGLVVVATQVERLQLVPVFLGFITYKFALLAYSFAIGLRESWPPRPNKL
ncbi:MAG: ATP synthase subunit I [Geitlerinemataceae cyanobacterium]